MGIVGKLEDNGVNAMLFVAGFVILCVTIAEMIEKLNAKQTDTDLYRTYIASLALSLTSVIVSLVRFTGQFSIYILIVVLILLGILAIGTTSKEIDDKSKADKKETDIYKLNVAGLIVAIIGIVFGAIVITLKIIAPSL